MIPVKRFQQSVFEALATSNRRIGNIAGVSGNSSAANYVTGIGTGWVTVTSIIVPIGMPSDLMIWSYVNFNRQTGTLGDTFFAEIQKDSDADHSQLDFPTDASFQSHSVPNDTLNRTLTLIAKYIALPPGNHTFRVKCSATGDTFQAIATIDLVQLSVTQT